MRCQDCGDENPKSGFYPICFIAAYALDWQVIKSGQLCNDCDAKRRLIGKEEAIESGVV